jgi:hypothetical protein
METEPIVVETGDLKIASASDDAEGIIECCYQLVCSGRPWPEILEEVKRLSDLSKQRDLDLPAEVANGQVIASKERVETRSPPCGVPFRRIIRDAPLSLVFGICILAFVAEATSPVDMPSSAKRASAATLRLESVTLQPNTTNSQETYGQWIGFTTVPAPSPSTGGGTFSTRDSVFGAGEVGTPQRNSSPPAEVLRPNPRTPAPAAPHRRR